MAQKTAKTIFDVLDWVENNGHHYASWCDEDGFLILKGFGVKLRIPVAVHYEVMGLIEPSSDEFDTRMYRANRKGRAAMKKRVISSIS